MKKNLGALFLFVLVCAIGARWLRGSEREELRRDMGRSLALLWDSSSQDVQLAGPDQGLQADVRVTMGSGNEDWNYQLLRFVAQRHRATRLERLSVR